MKKIYLLSLTAIVLLLGFACQPKQNDVEEPTLTLSTHDLSFDNAGAEQSVTITTNQNRWSASSPKEGDWVELSQNGNSLTVKLAPNAQGKSRQSIVLVNAGGIQEKIKITQSAADIVLEARPESISLPQAGGTKTLDISSNTEMWTASLDQEVDWLSIQARPSSGVILLEAQPNETSEVRQVKLIAKSGTKVIEVNISQEGKQKYILPILLKDQTNFDMVLKKEVQRGSIMKSFSDPGDFWGTHFPGTADFLTPSEVFPIISYTFDFIRGAMPLLYRSVLMTSYNYAEVSSEAFMAYLTEQGFVKKKTEKNVSMFENEDLSIQLLMTLYEGVGGSLEFSTLIKQDKAYPTFAAFPYQPMMSFVNVYTKKVEDIKADEANLGSTLTTESKHETFKEETEFLLFETVKKDHFLNRAYFFYTSATPDVTDEQKGSVLEAIAIFDNPNLALFEAYGEWYLTDEFKALLKKEGFEFVRKHKGSEIYHRSSDHLVLAIAPFKDTSIADGKTCLRINYFHMELSSTASQIFHNRPENIAELIRKDHMKLAKREDRFLKYLK